MSETGPTENDKRAECPAKASVLGKDERMQGKGIFIEMSKALPMLCESEVSIG